MRAAYFRGNQVIELVDVPRPELKPGEVLIKVAANGVCGSDRKILRGGFGLIPGHEVSGTVVEVTPGCETPVGARVAVYIPRHCGECVYCQAGRGNLCPHKPGLLGWSTDGGYAEYMALPDRNALRLDDRISLDQGVLLLDTLGTSSHGLRLARAAEAETALVIGAGPVGMGAVAYLTLWERKLLGFMQVRHGPNRVGPLGLLQPIADAVKLLTKEIIQPSAASKGLFVLGPVMAIMPALEPTNTLMMPPTIKVTAPTNSHLPMPEMSRLITLARLAMTCATRGSLALASCSTLPSNATLAALSIVAIGSRSGYSDRLPAIDRGATLVRALRDAAAPP